MGKVSYANMKLKVKNEVKTFKFQDNEIEVIQYLPISDKYDLIEITLQKSKENNLYNPLKIEMYFHLHLVYMYTNISFTEKQKEDEMKLYDCLENNGIIKQIIMNMNEEEYDFLEHQLNERIHDELKYNTTASAILNKIITDLPANAEAAMDIVNNFDQDKFKEVINFAAAVNNGKID